MRNGFFVPQQIAASQRRTDRDCFRGFHPAVTVYGDVNVVADDTNDALTIQVTSTSFGAVRWVASVRTVEVNW